MSSEEVEELAVLSHLEACRHPVAPGAAAEAAVGEAEGATGIDKEADNDNTANKKEDGSMDTPADPPQQRGVSEADEKKNPALVADKEPQGSHASQGKKKGGRNQASKAEGKARRGGATLMPLKETRKKAEMTSPLRLPEPRTDMTAVELSESPMRDDNGPAREISIRDPPHDGAQWGGELVRGNEQQQAAIGRQIPLPDPPGGYPADEMRSRTGIRRGLSFTDPAMQGLNARIHRGEKRSPLRDEERLRGKNRGEREHRASPMRSRSPGRWKEDRGLQRSRERGEPSAARLPPSNHHEREGRSGRDGEKERRPMPTRRFPPRETKEGPDTYIKDQSQQKSRERRESNAARLPPRSPPGREERSGRDGEREMQPRPTRRFPPRATKEGPDAYYKAEIKKVGHSGVMAMKAEESLQHDRAREIKKKKYEKKRGRSERRKKKKDSESGNNSSSLGSCSDESPFRYARARGSTESRAKAGAREKPGQSEEESQYHSDCSRDSAPHVQNPPLHRPLAKAANRPSLRQRRARAKWNGKGKGNQGRSKGDSGKGKGRMSGHPPWARR